MYKRQGLTKELFSILTIKSFRYEMISSINFFQEAWHHMIPKLENSFEALNAGVTEVVITLASAINENSGTRIKK